jgi:AcrR family transcriptional regulator
VDATDEGVAQPARRGRPPRHAPAEIVAAAVALADADGLDAVSMRAVAARLGAGAMSLYTYVPDKDALVAAMLETVSGEQRLPSDPSGDWRADLSLLAREQRALLHRHPWVVDALSHRQPLGPNTLAAFEFALAALEPTGQDLSTRAETFALLTGFVLNVVRAELADRAAAAGSPEAAARAQGRLVELLSSGRYPHVAATFAAAARQGGSTVADRFEALLTRMLAGLAGPA